MTEQENHKPVDAARDENGMSIMDRYFADDEATRAERMRTNIFDEYDKEQSAEERAAEKAESYKPLYDARTLPMAVPIETSKRKLTVEEMALELSTMAPSQVESKRIKLTLEAISNFVIESWNAQLMPATLESVGRKFAGRARKLGLKMYLDMLEESDLVVAMENIYGRVFIYPGQIHKLLSYKQLDDQLALISDRFKPKRRGGLKC